MFYLLLQLTYILLFCQHVFNKTKVGGHALKKLWVISSYICCI